MCNGKPRTTSTAPLHGNAHFMRIWGLEWDSFDWSAQSREYTSSQSCTTPAQLHISIPSTGMPPRLTGVVPVEGEMLHSPAAVGLNREPGIEGLNQRRRKDEPAAHAFLGNVRCWFVLL